MRPRWQVTGPADPNVQDFTCLLQFARKTGDDALRSQLIERIEPLLKQFETNPDSLQRRVDHSVFGAVLLELYLQTKNPRYLNSGKQLADRQWQNPRGDGLSSESRFRAEDMYLITTLQVQAFRATADPVYLDRAALTLSVYREKLQDGNGLFRHGPGACYWGRANGFAAVALATLLSELPATHPERLRLMTSYTSLMAAAAQHQGASGWWNQLLDLPDSYAELSGSAMLTCALAVGVKNGWLASDGYTSVTRRGWLALMDKMGNSGKVYQVSVAAEPSASVEYYLNLPVQRGGREGQNAVLGCALALVPQEPLRTK
jgi:rhamnogalacturonyl hydrolase YesR